MLLQEERSAVVKYGKMMIERRLTHGTGGNISVLDAERKLFAISPSAMPYDEITPEDVPVVDMSGKVVEGERKPSTELDMHRLIYADRNDIGAIVHTHSMFATAMSCTGHPVPPIHCAAAIAGPDVRCIPYFQFGTRELALAARDGIRGRLAVLLGNHGLVAAGADIDSAMKVAEEIEFVCELWCRTRAMGVPQLLGSADMASAAEKLKAYMQG